MDVKSLCTEDLEEILAALQTQMLALREIKRDVLGILAERNIRGMLTQKQKTLLGG